MHERSREAHRAVIRIREVLDRIPFNAALKAVLAERGISIRADVRPPLRQLTPQERMEAARMLALLPA